MEKKLEPFTLVVFGATGDLYQKKLAVALFNLFYQGLLPPTWTLIGFSRRPLSDDDFRAFTKEAIFNKIGKEKKYNEKTTEDFLKNLRYVQGDLEFFDDFKILNDELVLNDGKHKICSNKLFYLAVPPSLYGVIFKNISKAGLTVPCAIGTEREEAWTRILVEKPFGEDMIQAEHLDKLLGELFDESQIFRIDHYLAKEALHKILDFRFGTPEMESRWNKDNVESVRIIFHEEDGIGKRGAFYDRLGAFRDVGQNHMLQMLALVAMEKPEINNSDEIHKKREEVLKDVRLYQGKHLVRGQYDGYLEEPGVKTKSQTETFFSLTLDVNNKRWQGVPFFLEFGKGLDKSEVFIEVCFKTSTECLNFPISSRGEILRDAYEKVFYDCFIGDQTIFTSTGEIMAEWSLATEVINRMLLFPLIKYKKGSKGKDVK